MEIVLQVFILFFSIVVHECSHGWVALARGDTTARDRGRLTLNPLPHIDMFGTIILPLFQLLSMGKILFGYAKPVPINAFAMKNPKRDVMWVGLAGPVSNLILGSISGLLIRLNYRHGVRLPDYLIHPLIIFTITNFWLALVNFIPIPPLDGSRIITGILPKRALPSWLAFEQVGFFILILLVGTGFFQSVLAPILNSMILWITGIK